MTIQKSTHLLPKTQLDYLQNTYQFESEATFLAVSNDEQGQYLVLDRTIFYPQGGGQPWDLGSITMGDVSHAVQSVRYKDGIVCHYGAFAGTDLLIGTTVIQRIDPERRRLHARLHTAGHLIQAVVNEVYPNAKPLKGHHFPESPYVEFLTTNTIPETFAQELEKLLNEKIRQDLMIQQEQVSYDYLVKHAAYVPENLPKDKPLRIVGIGNYAPLPCGGTHVQSTKDIGEMHIPKIKVKQDVLRVSYNF